MSQWSATHRESRTPTPTSSPPNGVSLIQQHPSVKGDSFHPLPPPPPNAHLNRDYASSNSEPTSPTSPTRGEHAPSPNSTNDSPPPAVAGRRRSNSRPLSMVQTYHPHLMDMNEDTIPELQPIFGFLNSQSNKLYQEGYFLKLDDQDSSPSSLLPLFSFSLAPSLTGCSFALVSASNHRAQKPQCANPVKHRGEAQSGSNMDRMLCSACRHRAVAVGCCGTRRCRGRRRGSPQVPQLD